MVVSFMGITGPSGVLPRHYTQLLIDRIRRKDYALRDFLDLFNHRIISFFYRAWEKYHFPVAYEDAALDPDFGEEDLFTRSLYCLVGMGTGGLRNRLAIRDNVLLYYGGLFAHFPRNAISLQAMISDYFDLPARVLQFFGQWLYLSQDNQTCMPSPNQGEECNNQLGLSAVVGERVWGVESKFRVRLGPVGYQQFRRFTPMGDLLTPLGQMIRTYAGPDLDFDIQPVLRRQEVPCARLGGDESDPSCLGWNTWIRTIPLPHDARDAVFEFEGNLA
jgi:type VI secretion system protein ImpH